MRERVLLESESVPAWLERIRGSTRVMAPVQRGRVSFAFSWIEDPADVRLDYVRSILPPKQAFLPPREELLELRTDPLRASPKLAREPFVLLGVHPCDLTAISLLDWSMLERHNVEDPFYEARRDAATVVAVDCMPDKYCFCASVGSDRTREGADVFLTPVNGGYFAEGLTGKGERLLGEAKLRRATAAEAAEAKAWPGEKTRRVTLGLAEEASALPALLGAAYESEVWEKTSERCYSCGTCTTVCPTCFCFDVWEEPDLTLEAGSRHRQSDSCQFLDFAVVAGGHNFRGERVDRVRHRWLRKFVYLNREHGRPFCVGCGRCSQQCTAGISLVDVINSVAAGAKEGVA